MFSEQPKHGVLREHIHCSKGCWEGRRTRLGVATVGPGEQVLQEECLMHRLGGETHACRSSSRPVWGTGKGCSEATLTTEYTSKLLSAGLQPLRGSGWRDGGGWVVTGRRSGRVEHVTWVGPGTGMCFSGELAAILGGHGAVTPRPHLCFASSLPSSVLLSLPPLFLFLKYSF